MSTTIGCGTESGVKSEILRQIRDAETMKNNRTIGRGTEIEALAIKKYKLLKSIQMETYKFIPRALSKKLYERCIKNCHPDTLQCHRARMNHILSMRYQLGWATYVKFGKYTIVELEYNGKHYHGLAALAPCDMRTTSAGIAVAYRRAFENMLEDTLWH